MEILGTQRHDIDVPIVAHGVCMWISHKTREFGRRGKWVWREEPKLTYGFVYTPKDVIDVTAGRFKGWTYDELWDGKPPKWHGPVNRIFETMNEARAFATKYTKFWRELWMAVNFRHPKVDHGCTVVPQLGYNPNVAPTYYDPTYDDLEYPFDHHLVWGNLAWCQVKMMGKLAWNLVDLESVHESGPSWARKLWVKSVHCVDANIIEHNGCWSVFPMSWISWAPYQAKKILGLDKYSSSTSRIIWRLK